MNNRHSDTHSHNHHATLTIHTRRSLGTEEFNSRFEARHALLRLSPHPFQVPTQHRPTRENLTTHTLNQGRSHRSQSPKFITYGSFF